jgi:creatinine amidohydrolase
VGLLPVGATEQHGPHLPVGTDTMIATAVSEAAASGGGAIVLPALPVGASWWHGTGLAGTLALAGERVAELAAECARWAAHGGLRRLLFVNGHVGNAAPLWLACDRLRFERADLRVGVLEWWNLTESVAAEVTQDARDWHAHRAETALMLAIAPDLVDLASAKEADDEDRTAGLVFRYGAAAVTRNGVTGRPSQASAELGKGLWAEVSAAARGVVARARSEEPPLR